MWERRSKLEEEEAEGRRTKMEVVGVEQRKLEVVAEEPGL